MCPVLWKTSLPPVCLHIVCGIMNGHRKKPPISIDPKSSVSNPIFMTQTRKEPPMQIESTIVLARGQQRCICGALKPPKYKIEQLAQQDLMRTAFHEAGHATVAEHFGLKPYGNVFDTKCRCLEHKAYGGRMYHEVCSAFRRATISWAGVLAEGLLYSPSDEDFDDYTMLVWEEGTESTNVSNSDFIGIESHRHVRRTFNTSIRILLARRSRLCDIAEQLIVNRIFISANN
jgi:hypothetical protein